MLVASKREVVEMKTVILGGGISGLSAAWYLLKKDRGAQVVLLEKENRVGGWIESRTEKGFSFERGPRTLARSRSFALLQLIHELGLDSEVISSSKDAARRYLWSGGRLQSVGSFWPTLLVGLLREPFVKCGACEDESIYDFAARRFGARVAETFFDPMALGIFAGDIRKLSVRSCFRTLWEWERNEGSVLRGWFKRKKGPSGLFTLKGGLERLILELKRQLPIEIVTDCKVESIGSEVGTSKGMFQADRIISALPAYEISRLTGILLDIPYRSIWVVHLGFDSRRLKKKGFGYLVPSKEKEPLLGMVWDSDIFGEEPQTRLTAMVREEAADPIKEAIGALRRHLKIGKTPDFISQGFAKLAIPQFEIGHDEKILRFEKEIADKFPHLLVTGNYLSGASVEACVQRSKHILKY